MIASVLPLSISQSWGREVLIPKERKLAESVDLKVAKSLVHYWDSSLECQEKKYYILKETINSYGFV